MNVLFIIHCEKHYSIGIDLKNWDDQGSGTQAYLIENNFLKEKINPLYRIDTHSNVNYYDKFSPCMLVSARV